MEARFLGGHPRPCERGLRIDVRYVWTPQNGSFRKRIFWKRIRVHIALGYVHTYTFSKRFVLGCPHVSYINPETPFTRTWIDHRKRHPPPALPIVFFVGRHGLVSDSNRIFSCFLCLPVSFFCIASRACAPKKECT